MSPAVTVCSRQGPCLWEAWSIVCGRCGLLSGRRGLFPAGGMVQAEETTHRGNNSHPCHGCVRWVTTWPCLIDVETK